MSARRGAAGPRSVVPPPGSLEHRGRRSFLRARPPPLELPVVAPLSRRVPTFSRRVLDAVTVALGRHDVNVMHRTG